MLAWFKQHWVWTIFLSLFVFIPAAFWVLARLVAVIRYAFTGKAQDPHNALGTESYDSGGPGFSEN
jgi:hypothetical protein